MNSSDTYLYYPLIRVPDETLIYSLLYKNRIKRIIPPNHSVSYEDWEEFNRPNRIIKQALGYDFILGTDFYESKKAISEKFVEFINDAYKARNISKYEKILGEKYKHRFEMKNKIILIGTEYFLYAKKLDKKVFSLLDRIGWMYEDKETMRCKVEKELWHVYMTLLAANVSKLRSESISTNFILCEDLLRNKIFQEYFHELLPEQYALNSNLSDVCINLLFNNAKSGDLNDSRDFIPLHKIINIQQASYIRAGLEDKRQEFFKLINNLLLETESLAPNDEFSFLKARINDIKESAKEFNNQLNMQIESELTKGQKDLKNYWYAGCSLTFPLLGNLVDNFINSAFQLGMGTALGSILTTISFLALQHPNKNHQKNTEIAMSSRQNAYIFMNKLWEIHRSKSTETQYA